jgi:hypothetical protein
VVAIEPHVTLAFALRSNPGAYAVLLGAGVSIAAGVPSAWAVQEDLILKVAQAEGVTPEDPFTWYRERFGKPSTYDDLLDTLTHTPIERQALLRGYFEPTEEEREQGTKLPTAAHRAVARLVAAGLVRVIFANWAKDAAYSTVSPSGGWLPSSDYWYPDETGKWATTP